jgi:spore germination cell wall hydrolase CwlJ-like protein
MLLSDLDIAARTVYGEARGEGPAGRRGVAQVIVNRWRCDSGQFVRDDTLATACLRHKQFSAWAKGDPNLAAMQEVGYKNRDLLDCMRHVLEAVRSDADTLTMGSLHYHADHITPGWAEGHEPVVSLGHHKFYNTVN